MTAEDFVGIMSHIGFVGDPLVHTQHHIGASKWTKVSNEEVIGHHQLRAAHQRYTALDRKTVENKGHGHAMVKHLYKKIGGEWKLAGLRPTVRWNEFEFEKIFKGF
jgi:scytalone dehydratase